MLLGHTMGSIWTNSPKWPLRMQTAFKPAAIRELDELDLGVTLEYGASYIEWLASFLIRRNRTRAPDLHLSLNGQLGASRAVGSKVLSGGVGQSLSLS